MIKDPVQIRLSGSGGQGLITAGVILAEAALLDGRNVVQTQTYGPEARLGSSKAEVILSHGAIAYPQVTVPDVLLCLSSEAARKYTPQVHENTIVILDADCVDAAIGAAGKTARHGHIMRFPITKTAEAAGGKVVANVVALSVMNEICELVTSDNLREAVRTRVPERFRSLNERALEAGRQLAADDRGMVTAAMAEGRRI